MGQRRNYGPAPKPPSRALGVIVLCIVIFIAFMAAMAAASAHSWYPHECCHDNDCAEISADRVRTEAGGYVIDGRFHVLQRDVRTSPDGNYHGCFPAKDRLICFFAPPQGS